MRGWSEGVTLPLMFVRLAVIALSLAGCAKTAGPAPGIPDGEELVVTYYYLNF